MSNLPELDSTSLIESLREQLRNPARNAAERARLRCRFARQLEEAGDYEGAVAALGELFAGVGVRPPAVEDYDELTAAGILLRVGALTGWLGSLKQQEGAQSTAKDLLSESGSIYAAHGDIVRHAETLTELAYCYWREGAYDEARVILRDSLTSLARLDQQSQKEADEVRAVALLRSALIENSATRLNDSLRLLTEAAPLFSALHSHTLKGKYHNELATTLRDLGRAEGRGDYTDRALIEYAAASFHFEKAGHLRYCAAVENNLGGLFITINQLPEALQHLTRARRLFQRLKDRVHIAQVDETRTRALLAAGDYSQAEALIASVIEVLQQGDELALLAEARTTQGIIYARLHHTQKAQKAFRQAIELAGQAGDAEGAGLAALCALEELSSHLRLDEKQNFYKEADLFLARSQDSTVLARLRACAHQIIDAPRPHAQNLIDDALLRFQREVTFTPDAVNVLDEWLTRDLARETTEVIERTVAQSPQASTISADALEVFRLRGRAREIELAQPWANFSLKETLHTVEKQFIRLALKATGGRVSHSAKLLGFPHHESLSSLIQGKHQELAGERLPLTRRRRSIIKRRA